MSTGFGDHLQATFSGSPAAKALEAGVSAQRAKLKIGPGGRVVIPAAMREALQVSEGDCLVATCEQGELSLVSMKEAVRRAQAIVRQVVPAGAVLSDELIADRRCEAAREERE